MQCYILPLQMLYCCFFALIIYIWHKGGQLVLSYLRTALLLRGFLNITFHPILTLCSSNFMSWSEVFWPAMAWRRQVDWTSGVRNSKRSLTGIPRELLTLPDAGMASSNIAPRNAHNWKRQKQIIHYGIHLWTQNKAYH